MEKRGKPAAKLEGQVFGKLTVVKRSDRMRGKSFLWECSCECGGTNFVATDGLRSGRTKSCGCLKKENKSMLLSTEQWIKSAKEVHGSRYDYALSEYKGANKSVTILCNTHGKFAQRAADHVYRKAGCKECRKAHLSEKFSLTKDEFVERAVKIHGDKYDYSDTVYINSSNDITFYCKGHGGHTTQNVRGHLAGNGCRHCAEKYIDIEGNKELFLRNSEEKFGKKFDYSLVEYINTQSKVLIGCPLHGLSKQSPNSHLSSSNGCRSCAADTKSRALMQSQSDFLDSLYKVHGDKYDYSKLAYKGRKHKIEVVCREHGSFFTNAGNHQQGSGCPLCCTSGFKTTQSGVLYVLKAGDITKVGITNGTATNRCRGVAKDSGHPFEVIRTYHFEDGLVCLSLETVVLRELKKVYSNPEIKFPGYSECFLDLSLTDLYILIQNKMEEI